MCLRKAPCVSFWMGCHLFASFLAFSACFSIMPLEMESRKGVDTGITGFVLGVMYIPTFILGLFLNKLAHRFGRKALYLGGLYTFTITTLLFGLIEYAKSGITFLALAIIFRLIVGFGSFFTKTLLPSIMSKRFPDNLDSMFVYMGIWITIALGVGPAIGQQLYAPTGDNFFYPHLVVVIVISVLFIPSAHFMLREKSRMPSGIKPSDVPRSPSSNPNIAALKQQHHQPVPSNGSVMDTGELRAQNTGTTDSNRSIKSRKLKRVMTVRDEHTFPMCNICKSIRAITFSAIIFQNIFYLLFWQSILGLELEDYGKSSNYISLAYLIRPIVAVPVSLTVPHLSARLGRTVCIFVSSVVHFIAFLFMGPSMIFGLPGDPNLILLGLGLKGLADPFMFNLCIPEIIDFLFRKYEGQYEIGPISDVVSGFENFILDIASMVGTTIGFLIYQAIGFRYTCDLFFLFQIPFLTFLVLFGGVIPAFRKLQSDRRVLREKMQEIEKNGPNSSRKLQEDSPEKSPTAE